MKKIIFYPALFFLFYSVHAQPLIIKGKIKCLNQNVNSTKGAESIVVVPAFMPSHATITASQPSGYFEFNTGIPITILQDKIVSVYIISRCTNCKESAKRVFISEDQDRQNRDNKKTYVTVKDWMLNTNCQKAELIPYAADSILMVITKQPDQNLDKVSSASALTGAPAFLNFLTNLTTVVGATGFPNGAFTIDSLDPGKINYGKFLFASPLLHSANTGFNFSPARDMSEAVFWNPSAIANSRKPNNISLLTNLKNNVKLGGYYRLGEKVSLGGGFIYTMQDEFRKSHFSGSNGNIDPDTTIMKLKEYAALISPVFKMNNKLSVALTIKSIWQDFNIPNTLFVSDEGIGTFTDSSIKKQHFDVDISATYKITNSFQLGINLMNLAGSKLYADAFVSKQANIPMQKQRAFGIGLLYKWQRLNVGADLLFTDDGLYDAAFGVNYVPFNNALISAGIAVKQVSYSIAFRIKYFRIAYINDNDWVVNEKRKGKSAILNGRIYGGFIFDLN
jgi:hypothetical protein